MRALGAKGGIGIGLAILLVIGSVGGWLLLRSSGDAKDPIVVGVTDRAESLDPGFSYAAGSWDLYSNIFQGLLTLSTGSDTPVPDAAEKCAFTDNAMQVYRCTLRKGLKFTSGRTVTAEDVKFSIDRILAMAQRAEDDEDFDYSAGPISLVMGVEAVRTDGQDVIFELSEPDVTFPYVLAGGVGSIVDREVYELDAPRDDNRAVGSGPYVLKEFLPLDVEAGTVGHAILEPNPDYKGAVEVSDYPITLRYYLDGEGLQEAWENREIDLNGGQMAPEAIVGVDRHSLDVRYSETTGSTIRAMVNGATSDSTMSDLVVRQSVAALIDREAMASQVLLHTVEPAYSLIPVGLTGHGTPYYDRYGQVTSNDVRDRLTAAGYSLPMELTFGYAGQVRAEEVEFVKETLEADGIFEVTVLEKFAGFGLVFTALSDGDIDSYFVGWRPDFSDPDTYTSPLLGEGSVLSHGWSHSEIDKLIKATKAQPQRGATTEDFRMIHDIAAEQAVVVPIWQDRNFALADREVTGMQHLRDAGGIFRLWELSRI